MYPRVSRRLSDNHDVDSLLQMYHRVVVNDELVQKLRASLVRFIDYGDYFGEVEVERIHFRRRD